MDKRKLDPPLYLWLPAGSWTASPGCTLRVDCGAIAPLCGLNLAFLNGWGAGTTLHRPANHLSPSSLLTSSEYWHRHSCSVKMVRMGVLRLPVLLLCLLRQKRFSVALSVFKSKGFEQDGLCSFGYATFLAIGNAGQAHRAATIKIVASLADRRQ